MKRRLVLIILVSLFQSISQAGLPVVASPDQKTLLVSADAHLATNKKLVYDFWRVVLIGLHLDQVNQFLSVDYIQHNPNVQTGRQGFVDFFSKLGGPRTIPDQIPDLVSIQAEGDLVTFSLVNQLDDPQNPGSKYTTTWFDMFRIQDGQIVEHWDCDVKQK